MRQLPPRSIKSSSAGREGRRESGGRSSDINSWPHCDYGRSQMGMVASTEIVRTGGGRGVLSQRNGIMQKLQRQIANYRREERRKGNIMFRGAAGGPHRPSRIRRGDERRKHVKITEEDAEHARTVRCSLGATADTVGVLWPQLLRLPFSGQESNFDRLSHSLTQGGLICY